MRNVRSWSGSVAGAAAVILLAGCDPVTGGGASWVLPPETAVSDAVRALYHEDAVRLALRQAVAERLPAADQIQPPAALVARYEAALLGVYRLDHPARQEVVDVYDIHTFPAPATRELLVGVSGQAAWTQAWRSGSVVTGNATIDDLVTRYGLTLDRFYQWSFGEYALLRTAAPLNVAALAKAFRSVSGVTSADGTVFMGDGADIRASGYGDGVRLDYSVGFGDCPAGCIGRHTWSFAVRPDGRVQFLGESGPPVPSGAR